jgi:hypothetical protein
MSLGKHELIYEVRETRRKIYFWVQFLFIRFGPSLQFHFLFGPSKWITKHHLSRHTLSRHTLSHQSSLATYAFF